MTEPNVENPIIDFSLASRRRRFMLYLKRPAGSPIPVNEKWKCACGVVNSLNDQTDQYCTKCGSRLRMQENADKSHTYFTCVIVTHFSSLVPKGKK